jgi:predicted lipoprotein with Yx(FWY)xxD motif
MRRIFVVLSACALLGACGGQAEEPSGAGAQPREDEQATVEVASSDFGDILVDSQGMTLYMFVPDQQKGGRPTCYGECAKAWPALEAPTGDLVAGEGVDDSLLGTAKRRDGTTQVTYGDLPLYLFSGDQSAGDTEGQSLNDVWWVVSPEGKPVHAKQGGDTGTY